VIYCFPLPIQAPRISGIKVYDANVLRDEIIVEINVAYFGDSSLQCGLSFGQKEFGGGIQNIEFSGTLRIVLRPLIPYLPMVGAIQISFLKCPEINLLMTGQLAGTDASDISAQLPELLKNALEGYLIEAMVLPNSLFIPLNEKVHFFPNEMNSINGVIRCAVIKAEDLEVESDANGDPKEVFAIITVGKRSVTSDKVQIDKDESATFNFVRELVVDGKDEKIEIKICIEDDKEQSVVVGK